MCGAPMNHEDHEAVTADEGGAKQCEPAGSMSIACSNGGALYKHMDPPRPPTTVCICSAPNTCPYKLAAAAAAEAAAAAATQGASSGMGDALASDRALHADSGGDSQVSTALTAQGAGITMGAPGSARSHGSADGGADARRAAPVPPTPCPDRGLETPPMRLRRAPVLAPDGTWHLGTWQLAAVLGREARLPPLPGYDSSARFGACDMAAIMREIHPAPLPDPSPGSDRSARFGACDMAAIMREIPPAPLPGPDPNPKHTRARSAGAPTELATLPAPKPLAAISERPAAVPALRLRLALRAIRGLGAASGQPKAAPKSNFDPPGGPQLAGMQFGTIYLYSTPSCISFLRNMGNWLMAPSA